MDTVHLRSGKYWLPIVIYAFSFVRINDSGIADFYKMYLGTFFVPGLVLIQICLLFRGQKKRRKNSFCSGCFNGIYSELYRLCGIEPEKRMYPLAMGVDVSEGEYILTYAMPDLPRATGQGKEEEDGNQTLQVRGKSFEEIKSRYERSQEKYLDIGHLQILILSQDLTETDMWKDFLNISEKNRWQEKIYMYFRRRNRKNCWAGRKVEHRSENILQVLWKTEWTENRKMV